MKYSNTQIEKVIIGCILLDGSRYEKIIGKITANDFTDGTYRKLFQLFGKFYKKEMKIDIATIMDAAYKNEILNNWINANDLGMSVLIDIQNSVPNLQMLDQYIKILKNDTYNRTILKATENFRIGKIKAKELEEIINKIKPPEEIEEKTNKEIILKTLEEAERGTDFKFPENFEDLNKITGGFDRGDLIIIGGYPSNGKTSLCNDLTKGFCNSDYKVLVITLEMSTRANMRRILANTQEINTMRFRHGNLTELDREKIRVMIPIINDVWNYNCIRAYTMPDIIRAISKYKPDIVIIDYLQNIADPENLSEYARLTKFTLQIQQIGRAKNTSIILVSQFHRPQEGKVRVPRNNDFRGSGSIEERAEIILLIYWERKLKMEALSRRDGDDPEYVRIDITKNKDGETGFIQMKLYPEYHRWINWDDKGDKKEVIKYESAKKKGSKYRKERKDIDG
ncbi:Replicative DNA helicase [subsurface metagenome]